MKYNLDQKRIKLFPYIRKNYLITPNDATFNEHQGN